MSDYFGPDPETIEQMQKEKEGLIQRLQTESAMLDRLRTVLTFRNICHECGRPRDECVSDESCDDSVQEIENWLDEMNEVLLGGLDD